MKKIDFTNWKRRTTYNNFIQYTDPTFSIGTRLDVTDLLMYCRDNSRNFFATFLYVFSRCANEIEEFRTRIVGEDVVLFDCINPSYIVLLENEELVTCCTEYTRDYNSFHDRVRKNIETVKERNVATFNDRIRLDCFYVSCLPWMDFTSVKNPYNHDDKSVTSIPRITWGKYVKTSDGRYEIAFDVAAHHGLIDGKQVATLYESMTRALSQVNEFLRGV